MFDNRNKGKPHYYHCGAVMSVVENGPKRLLSRVSGNHKNFVDIVTYDALACNSKFINHCIDLEVDAVSCITKQ